MASRERGNPEVKRTFERLGGVAEKKQDLYHALRALGQLRGENDAGDHSAGGHPDYTVLLPPFGFYIEAKAGHNNRFDFDQIDEKQRNYLDLYAPISYLWLWMGEGRPTDNDNPRMAWLIPWKDWLDLEQLFAAHSRVSIPYEAASGLDADTYLDAYKLTWVGKGCWDIPPKHPLWFRLTTEAREFAKKCELWSTGYGKAEDERTSSLA